MKMSNTSVIHMENVTKAVQQKEIIKSCHMSVRQNTIYGLLGPNGAGKTTLFKLLTGYMHATAGKIEVFGLDMKSSRNTIIRNIGSMIEAPVFYEHVSAEQNISIHLSYMGLASKSIRVYLEMVGLGDISNQPVSQFSTGMRQRLGVARAFSHQPKILILDEPINGMDAMGIKAMRQLFSKLATEHGMTILLSSHILHEIEQIADTIGVITNGTIIEEAEFATIKRAHPEGLEDYFLRLLQKEAIQ